MKKLILIIGLVFTAQVYGANSEKVSSDLDACSKNLVINQRIYDLLRTTSNMVDDMYEYEIDKVKREKSRKTGRF